MDGSDCGGSGDGRAFDSLVDLDIEEAQQIGGVGLNWARCTGITSDNNTYPFSSNKRTPFSSGPSHYSSRHACHNFPYTSHSSLDSLPDSSPDTLEIKYSQ